MQSITLKTHVGSDGILKLEVPVGLTDVNLEVVVTLQALNASPDRESSDDSSWPPDFFERTFGILANEPLEREAQGENEVRNSSCASSF
ncbi:MAG TPA: hypothetical protein VF707_10925 [Ardenticatenaceae bacterium]|jgi:hypothetical protein